MAGDIPATSDILLTGDQSREFLDSLLGQGWEKWGQGLGGPQGAELMLEIFSVFNLVALAIISALFIWVLSIAVAGTAHEGTPFGKRYSSLWMPVRFVGAMGALAPIFKGLSLFQVALLACIGWSINLGNHVWELGVDYFVEHGGQLTIQAPSQNVTQYAAVANGALESLTLQHYLQRRRGLAVTPGGEWGYGSDIFGRGGRYRFRFNGNAGAISVECVDASDALCLGKRNAVQTAISSLTPVAAQLADPDTPADAIDPLALHRAANAVNADILAGLQDYARQGRLRSKLDAFRSTADGYGWFVAGASYWSISWINQETRAAMYAGLEYEPPEWTRSEWLGMTHGFADADAVRERVENYVKSAHAARRGVPAALSQPSVTDETGWFGKVLGTIRATINNTIAGSIIPEAVALLSRHDPIMALSSVGDYLIGAGWALVTALGAATFFSADAAGSIVSFALFAGVMPLILFGLALAYYLPAIPFIRWISALAGWVLLIVESLVAAPLWICAHALPEGEGAAGQHGRRGYLLFLGVILRPPLMVAGFFGAVILMNVLGRLLGQGFEILVSGAAQTKMLGVTGTISMVVILGIIVMMLANKFFSLIHYLPEHVTGWIGQQLHSLGEKEDQGGVKGVFVGSTSPVSEGARELRSRLDSGRGGASGTPGGSTGRSGTASGPSVSESSLSSTVGTQGADDGLAANTRAGRSRASGGRQRSGASESRMAASPAGQSGATGGHDDSPAASGTPDGARSTPGNARYSAPVTERHLSGTSDNMRRTESSSPGTSSEGGEGRVPFPSDGGPTVANTMAERRLRGHDGPVPDDRHPAGDAPDGTRTASKESLAGGMTGEPDRSGERAVRARRRHRGHDDGAAPSSGRTRNLTEGNLKG